MYTVFGGFTMGPRFRSRAVDTTPGMCVAVVFGSVCGAVTVVTHIHTCCFGHRSWCPTQYYVQSSLEAYAVYLWGVNSTSPARRRASGVCIAAASAHRRLRQAGERVAVLEPLTSVSAAAAVAGCIEGLTRWMNTTMIDAEVLSS